MGDGFTRAIWQTLFPEVLFPNFCSSTVDAIPRDMGRSDLSRSPDVGSQVSAEVACALISSNPVSVQLPEHNLAGHRERLLTFVCEMRTARLPQDTEVDTNVEENPWQFPT